MESMAHQLLLTEVPLFFRAIAHITANLHEMVLGDIHSYNARHFKSKVLMFETALPFQL